jgi:hypothetical protein
MLVTSSIRLRASAVVTGNRGAPLCRVIRLIAFCCRAFVGFTALSRLGGLLLARLAMLMTLYLAVQCRRLCRCRSEVRSVWCTAGSVKYFCC